MKNKLDDIKKMEYAIKSFANAAIYATKTISEFGDALNAIKEIEIERKRQLRRKRISWIKYYILFGWSKNIFKKEQ